MTNTRKRIVSPAPACLRVACVCLFLFGQAATAKAQPATAGAHAAFAMINDGDIDRGAKLFADEQRLGCSKCHSIDGTGLKAGPDLFAVGERFARRELIQTIINPSAEIAVGYSTTVVETKSGEEYQGVLKQASDDWIELMGADSQRIRIATADIEDQRGSDLSLMPEGLQAGLAMQEFTDLISYLVTLKQPVHSHATRHGMPETIPQIAHPATVHPFLGAELHVPPGTTGQTGKIQTGLVWFEQVPGLRDHYLALDQAGLIWAIDKSNGGERTSVFADLTREVFSARGPNGLLGLAFHPKFALNHKYYLKHQVFEDGKIATLLVEREATQDFARDSGNPSRRLLKIVAVAEHHNGGCIQFGPDGYLYFGMGDSAPNFDPQGQAQNLGLLFGKMLRLDVDRRDPGLEYGIPIDNPFVGQPGVRPEIWAYGFREPWRFSFDPENGDLSVADLGQERGDEVASVHRGENHGWNVFEGFELFSTGQLKKDAGYAAPLFALLRKHGSAVMGGYVLRGATHGSFHGVYVFGDKVSKRIWGMTQENGVMKTIHQLAVAPQEITAFAVDDRGGVFAVGYQGMVYNLDFSGSAFDETSDIPSC
ncbi:MAG: PQQ-dependent sugar dehydrogenase [Verrucomicrobia bacterium]|nr:PQQ-dependent sugar dehydrogenase [Verrucomicrobiota bacterium]